MLKPKFKNWYLAESYLLGGGSFILLIATLFCWLINANEIIEIIINITKCFLPICVTLIVLTFIFEHFYNYIRACK